MLDIALDHMQGFGDAHVRNAVPEAIKLPLDEPLPLKPQVDRKIAVDMVNLVLPYGVGKRTGGFRRLNGSRDCPEDRTQQDNWRKGKTERVSGQCQPAGGLSIGAGSCL